MSNFTTFRGLEFESPTDIVLRPYLETGMLVDAAVRLLPAGGLLADIGTGSGNIVVSVLKERPDVMAVASDISTDALAVAHRNAIRHGVKDRILFVVSDMAEGLPTEVFDCATCNPPYCPDEECEQYEERDDLGPRLSYDGGADGMEMMRRMFDGVPRAIKADGFLITELNDGQKDAMHRYALDSRSWRCVEIAEDACGVPRCMTLRKHSTGGNNAN